MSNYYAVARGRSVGIFSSWDDCKEQVNGFPNARYKKFSSAEAANSFIEQNQGGGSAGGSSNFSYTSGGPSRPAEGGASYGRNRSYQYQSIPSSNYEAFPPAYYPPEPLSSRQYEPEPTQASYYGTLAPSFSPPPSALYTSSYPSYDGYNTDGVSFQPSVSSSSTAQKRSMSSSSNPMKVTDERVINKRVREPNVGANLDRFTVDKDGYVVAYTDGACTKNGQNHAKAGIGVWFGDNHPLNISEPVVGRQTNNTAEIQAAERAIMRAKENGINKVNIQTDSQFTINCVTKWMNNWKRNNWRLSSGGDVKNKEDLMKLDSAVQDMEIKWSYVAGHKGIHGNEAADRLAVSGAEKSRKPQ